MKENIINHIKSGGVKMNEEFVGVILFIVIVICLFTFLNKIIYEEGEKARLQKRKEKEKEEKRQEKRQRWLKLHDEYTGHCHECKKSVEPKYLQDGGGFHRNEWLWRYDCDCGNMWRKYWIIDHKYLSYCKD